MTRELPAGGEPAEFIQYTEGDRVHGGQVTLIIVAMHNVDFPQNKVTLSDLKPSYDPEHNTTWIQGTHTNITYHIATQKDC